MHYMDVDVWAKTRWVCSRAGQTDYPTLRPFFDLHQRVWVNVGRYMLSLNSKASRRAVRASPHDRM